MTKEQIVESMIIKAESDAQTAVELFKIGRNDWCLFIWHLAIEKILKALILTEGEQIEYTHKLLGLARRTSIKLSLQQEEYLREITTYNIEARYDDYKLSFYYKANKSYTRKWNLICADMYKLFKDRLNEKKTK